MLGINRLFRVLKKILLDDDGVKYWALSGNTFQVYSKVILTGTPIENKLHDLWSIFDILMPGYLGTRTQFTKRFSKTPELLAQAIKPFLLRRTKNILREKLPEKIINLLNLTQS